MSELWKFLTKGPKAIIALVISAILLFLADFDLGFSPLSLHRAAFADRWLAVGAVLFFLLGVGILIGPYIPDLLPWRLPRAPVTRIDGGYAVQANKGQIVVLFGKLDEMLTPISEALVVLPANEYFDDECIRDTGSSLGSFVQKHFPRKETQFLGCVRERLPEPQARILKMEAELADSFGVGTTAFLDRPLGTTWRLLVAAVTSQRAGLGLQADVATLFRVVTEVGKTMADRRINEVFLPLLGAGHGGLQPRTSLFCLTLGFADLMCHRGAHEIRKVTIVVYRQSVTSDPAVPEKNVRRILAAAVGMYVDA
jgi:Domain of unknown function (DUF6430)